jgi:hypothetical protein
MAKGPTIKHGGVLIAEGEAFTIIAAVVETGKSPFFDEFYTDLNSRYKDALQKGVNPPHKDYTNYSTLKHYFDKFKDHGSWKNNTQLNDFEGYDNFFEFKCNETGLRIPFYYDKENRKVIILTHYFEKKGNKTPPKELKRMCDIKERFEKIRKEG